jgi:uridine kinase
VGILTRGHSRLRMLTANKVLLIGIEGGSCAGKRTIARCLASVIGGATVLCLDSFYLPFDRAAAGAGARNFDHPSALDWDLLAGALDLLLGGQPTQVPVYDYVSGLRIESTMVEPNRVVIVHGLWPFFHEKLRVRFDIRVFVDTPADIRLVRRLKRDLGRSQRGWTLDQALDYYTECVRPMHATYIEDGRAYATVVVDGTLKSTEAARLIWSTVQGYDH